MPEIRLMASVLCLTMLDGLFLSSDRPTDSSHAKVSSRSCLQAHKVFVFVIDPTIFFVALTVKNRSETETEAVVTLLLLVNQSSTSTVFVLFPRGFKISIVLELRK